MIKKKIKNKKQNKTKCKEIPKNIITYGLLFHLCDNLFENDRFENEKLQIYFKELLNNDKIIMKSDIE